jgi:hypothetical protein
MRTSLVVVVTAIAFLSFGAQVLAAPEGQIVIAQGGDPSTLDPHMHAELWYRLPAIASLPVAQ